MDDFHTSLLTSVILCQWVDFRAVDGTDGDGRRVGARSGAIYVCLQWWTRVHSLLVCLKNCVFIADHTM